MQVLSHSDPALELARVETLLARQIDGLVLVPSAMPAQTLDTIARSGVPTVVVDRLTDDQRFDTVTLDDAGAMRRVTEHLLSLGHRRILYCVRYPELVTTQARIRSFEATMREAGPAVQSRVLAGPEPARLCPRPLQRSPRPAHPTAIIASNSILAQWTHQALTGPDGTGPATSRSSPSTSRPGPSSSPRH